MALTEGWNLTKDSYRVKDDDPRGVCQLVAKGTTIQPPFRLEDYAEAPPLSYDEHLEFQLQMLRDHLKRDETPEERAAVEKYLKAKMVSGPPQNKAMKRG